MLFKLLVVCACLIVSSCSLVAAECKGTPNLLEPWTGEPTFVKQVPHGKLYTIKNDVEPNIAVLHLYGTPYEMGYAYGQLLGPQIKQLLDEVFEFIKDEVDKNIQFLPDFLRQIIKEYGVKAAMDLTWWLTKPYIPEHFNEELRGIAAGGKLDFDDLMRINLFPELIQARCSMFGAWGPAIQNTSGTLYQLRALDWATNGPFQKFPLITVYHPSDPNSFSFATVGWSGFIGAITGISSSPVGICEKVFLAYNGTQSRIGYPWHFMLRDILQFDVDIASATNRMINAKRTCSVWLGVGDGHTNQFRLYQYSHDYVRVFDDINFPAYDNHPLMPGLVWVDKHVQPTKDSCMADLLKKHYGNISPETTIKYITAQHQTGDMHIAIYDYANMHLYVSNASPVDAQGKVVDAYNRRFARLDLKKLFAEPAPSF